MRIHSHYRLLEARLPLALAALAYLFATASAPALHLASEMQGGAPYAHGHAAAVQDDAAVQGAGEAPLPLPPDSHDDLDCLFCQVLSFSPHPTYGGATSAPDRAAAAPAARLAAGGSAPAPAAQQARAPPHA